MGFITLGKETSLGKENLNSNQFQTTFPSLFQSNINKSTYSVLDEKQIRFMTLLFDSFTWINIVGSVK